MRKRVEVLHERSCFERLTFFLCVFFVALTVVACSPSHSKQVHQPSQGQRPAAETPIQSTQKPESSTSKRCVLLRGPYMARGIPFLSPNILRYWYGTYQMGSDIVKVYYTTDRVQSLPSWEEDTCGPYRLREVSSRQAKDTATVYFYDNMPQWSLFFEFPAAVASYCPFVEMFIQRFRYFLSSLQQDQSYTDTKIVPFPAILNLQ